MEITKPGRGAASCRRQKVCKRVDLDAAADDNTLQDLATSFMKLSSADRVWLAAMISAHRENE